MATFGICEEKYRLLEEYKNCLTVFSELVRVLDSTRATTSKEQYELLRLRVNQAHERCEEARLAWERHVREHGC